MTLIGSMHYDTGEVRDMAIEKVREYLKQWNKDKDIIEFAVSSATVELAAEAAGVIPARIAKTLLSDNGGCVLRSRRDAKSTMVSSKSSFT